MTFIAGTITPLAQKEPTSESPKIQLHNGVSGRRAATQATHKRVTAINARRETGGNVLNLAYIVDAFAWPEHGTTKQISRLACGERGRHENPHPNAAGPVELRQSIEYCHLVFTWALRPLSSAL